MIISLNWLKKFTNIDVPIDELATLIGARLVEIEEVVNLAKKYEKVVIVKAVDASKLEGSDHLSVVKIDDGGAVSEIERDENGLIQVVCGAPNIKSGQTVVWLPPSSIVPEAFASDSPFELGSRKLCGVMSNGMIASAKELDLFDEHDGILVIDDEFVAGESFATAFELDDYLLDIENKSLTHRPDCFGVIGFAREIAAIQGYKFETPDWLKNIQPAFAEALGDVELNVTIDDFNLSSRYQAVVMSGADSFLQSPFLIQTYLARVGIRPINAVVDVTNYLMMLTGQPLHAFDYDKVVAVSGGKADIHVRAGRSGEKLTLLDDRIVELTPDDIVIAAGETAIGLAGAMGGANTEIDNNTKNIIIESATFNLYNLRATQMRHGIFSEAITRFTKGQPADLAAPVLSMAIDLMNQWSGAKCISSVKESKATEGNQPEIALSSDIVNGVLGTDYDNNQIVKIIENVEFDTNIVNGCIKVEVPYWRSDIHIVEDVIEEIGRLDGFDNIIPTLPKRDFVAVRPMDIDLFRSNLRKILSSAGANEVLNYSFIHGEVLNKVGQLTENSYRINNSISPDLQYYRQSLTPSLLGIVHSNIKQGFSQFALYELNKTHEKNNGVDDENVPIETNSLSLIIADKAKLGGAAYYQAKYLFDYLLQRVGVKLYYKPMADFGDCALFAPFESRRSAVVIDGDRMIGVVGEYKKSVAKSFKLPEFVAGFEVDIDELLKSYENAVNCYRPLSRYPATDRDICFQVDSSVSYGQIINAVNSALDEIELESSVEPIDIYQSEGSRVKNITIRIKLISHDRTLSGEEIANAINHMISSVVAATYAKVL